MESGAGIEQRVLQAVDADQRLHLRGDVGKTQFTVRGLGAPQPFDQEREPGAVGALDLRKINGQIARSGKPAGGALVKTRHGLEGQRAGNGLGGRACIHFLAVPAARFCLFLSVMSAISASMPFSPRLISYAE